MTQLTKRFRHEIPVAHRHSLDTRIQWLWHQRFGTTQSVWKDSKDILDHTAATVVLQAILGQNLLSIELLFERLEGGASLDVVLQSDDAELRI